MSEKVKPSLKTFPDLNDEKYDLWDGWTNEDLRDIGNKQLKDIIKWKKDFEAELQKSKRNEDSKSLMLGIYAIGWNDCIKKILGE